MSEELIPTPETDNLRLTLTPDSWETAYWKMKFHADSLERRLIAEKEEHAETRKDYMCLANQLDGHDATECALNLSELKRRLIVARDALKSISAQRENRYESTVPIVANIADEALTQTAPIP